LLLVTVGCSSGKAGESSVRAAIRRTLDAPTLAGTMTLGDSALTGPPVETSFVYRSPGRLQLTIPGSGTDIVIGGTKYQDYGETLLGWSTGPLKGRFKWDAWQSVEPAAVATNGQDLQPLITVFQALVTAKQPTTIITGSGASYSFASDADSYWANGASCVVHIRGTLKVGGGWVVEVSDSESTTCLYAADPARRTARPIPGSGGTLSTTVTYADFNAAPPITAPPASATNQNP